LVDSVGGRRYEKPAGNSRFVLTTFSFADLNGDEVFIAHVSFANQPIAPE
jgi:hypothetical protein